MTKPRFFLRLCLLAVLLVGCAPATSTIAPTGVVAVEPNATLTTSVPTLDTAARATAVPTESLAATALPVATSRGPDLHATDPSTVRLASGGLQLVEFFRFT